MTNSLSVDGVVRQTLQLERQPNLGQEPRMETYTLTSLELVRASNIHPDQNGNLRGAYLDLIRAYGTIKEAAGVAGCSRQTFYRRLGAVGINLDEVGKRRRIAHLSGTDITET